MGNIKCIYMKSGKPVHILEGEGKVVKMHYVHPSMTMNSYSDFPGSF